MNAWCCCWGLICPEGAKPWPLGGADEGVARGDPPSTGGVERERGGTSNEWDDDMDGRGWWWWDEMDD